VTPKEIGVLLAGPIRNLTIGSSGDVRVGAEFVDLDEGERCVLESLEHVKLAW
jgi:hypothetical protein